MDATIYFNLNEGHIMRIVDKNIARLKISKIYAKKILNLTNAKKWLAEEGLIQGARLIKRLIQEEIKDKLSEKLYILDESLIKCNITFLKTIQLVFKKLWLFIPTY